MLVSGWGDVEGMREDLFKDWGEMLDRWDGKDKGRPSRVVKLCRKVCKLGRQWACVKVVLLPVGHPSAVAVPGVADVDRGCT